MPRYATGPGRKTIQQIEELARHAGFGKVGNSIHTMIRYKRLKTIQTHQTPGGFKWHSVSDDEANQIIDNLRRRQDLVKEFASEKEILERGKDLPVPVRTRFLTYLGKNRIIPGIIEDPTTVRKKYLFPKTQVSHILFRWLQQTGSNAPGFLTPKALVKRMQKEGVPISLDLVGFLIRTRALTVAAQYFAFGRPNNLIAESDALKMIACKKAGLELKTFLNQTREMPVASAINLAQDIERSRRPRKDGFRSLYSFADVAKVLGIKGHTTLLELERAGVFKSVLMAGHRFITEPEFKKARLGVLARRGMRAIRKIRRKRQSIRRERRRN